jgi:hypothetical protein
MTSRITFLIITLFWLTMTYLLWRSEYVGQNQVGGNVPVELVWRKILTAPDNSRLEIMHKGRKMGYCQWMANIGQDLAVGRILTDDAPTEEVPPALSSYRLNLDGNVAFSEAGNRLKFDMEMRLSTNQAWQAFDLRLNMRPTIWELHSVASEQKLRFVTEDREGKTEQVFKFSDLQNPQALMQYFDTGVPLGMLGALSPFSGGTNAPGVLSPASVGLNWKARNDWISIGHTSVRAYRLEAILLERFRMRIIVSRVGEILRVDLPDEWELVNDQLSTL